MSIDKSSLGSRFFKELNESEEVFFSIGVEDILSATIANKYMNNHKYCFFLSGLAKTYLDFGFPDAGYIFANQILEWSRNLKRIFPHRHIIADIDEGLGNLSATKLLLGDLKGLASAVQLDDQDHENRRCGHLNDKHVVDLKKFLNKLEAVLEYIGSDILIIARTDEKDFNKSLVRVKEFSKVGAPIVLIDGLSKPESILKIREVIDSRTLIMFNYIQGGKCKPFTSSELKKYGGKIMNFSIPFLLSYAKVIEKNMKTISENDGFFPLTSNMYSFKRITEEMENNWKKFLS